MDLPQAFGVDHILILVQMLSHAGASHNRSPLSLHIRSAEDISEDLFLHYQDPFKLFGDYFLIQAI